MNDGSTGARIKVPLRLAPKEQVLVRLREDPNIDRPTQLQLPSMAFEMTDMQYNSGRKLSTVQRIVRKSETNASAFKHQYVPVPYDLFFNLYILVKNKEDGSKIIEQILPRFPPELHAALEIVPEMNIIQDIGIVLTSTETIPVFSDDTYSDHRADMWVLRFVMHAFFYGPVDEKPIIKFSKTNFIVGEVNEGDPFLRITKTPGLNANGEPTSDPSESVDPLTIFVDDDWIVATEATNEPE